MQLPLLILLTVNIFQNGHCFQSKKNDNCIYQNLYNATSRFLTSLLPPLCSDIFANKNNIRSQYISSKGLSGRIIPLGTFPTQDLAMDYFYGMLCPVGLDHPLRAYYQAVDLIRVTYDPKAYITQGEFTFYLTNQFRFTVFARLAFDKDYKICGYDSQMRNIGLTFDGVYDQYKDALIDLVCNISDVYCTGPSKQYRSFNDCKQYLTTQIPFGTFDRADQGNFLCRTIHLTFVPLDPERYCPRIGRSGGDICTDKAIDFYYNQPDYLSCAHKYA